MNGTLDVAMWVVLSLAFVVIVSAMPGTIAFLSCVNDTAAQVGDGVAQLESACFGMGH